MGLLSGWSKSELRSSRAVVGVALVIGALALVSFVSGTEAQSVPEPQYTGKGPEACLSCHGGADMMVIAETAHGDAGNPHTPYAQDGCESCHGPGSFHVSSSRGGVGFPPLNSFGLSDQPVEGQFNSCLGCHAEPAGNRHGIGWVGSLHDTSGMNCSTCHAVHSNENPLADTMLQQTLCARCHGTQNSKHAGFEDSGIQLATLKCTTCHDVHQLRP
ncbi:MAG: cytochrome c3 family protein [Geminicoccaceae bacterium]